MTLSSTMHRLAPVLLVLTLVLPARAQSNADVIGRLKATYDRIDALRAEFSMSMSSAYTDDVQTQKGTLTMQKEKLRIETGEQTIVNDGVQTYIYNPSQQQVLISNSDEEAGGFSPNEFFFNYDEHYDVSAATPVTLGGERHHKLTLAPKAAESFFSEVTLWVRDHDTLITRMEVKDVNETTMLFTLEDIQLNPPVNARTFSFEPPQGVEVVDLRS